MMCVHKLPESEFHRGPLFAVYVRLARFRGPITPGGNFAFPLTD